MMRGKLYCVRQAVEAALERIYPSFIPERHRRPVVCHGEQREVLARPGSFEERRQRIRSSFGFPLRQPGDEFAVAAPASIDALARDVGTGVPPAAGVS